MQKEGRIYHGWVRADQIFSRNMLEHLEPLIGIDECRFPVGFIQELFITGVGFYIRHDVEVQEFEAAHLRVIVAVAKHHLQDVVGFVFALQGAAHVVNGGRVKEDVEPVGQGFGLRCQEMVFGFMKPILSKQAEAFVQKGSKLGFAVVVPNRDDHFIHAQGQLVSRAKVIRLIQGQNQPVDTATDLVREGRKLENALSGSPNTSLKLGKVSFGQVDVAAIIAHCPGWCAGTEIGQEVGDLVGAEAIVRLEARAQLLTLGRCWRSGLQCRSPGLVCPSRLKSQVNPHAVNPQH